MDFPLDLAYKILEEGHFPNPSSLKKVVVSQSFAQGVFQYAPITAGRTPVAPEQLRENANQLVYILAYHACTNNAIALLRELKFPDLLDLHTSGKILFEHANERILRKTYQELPFQGTVEFQKGSRENHGYEFTFRTNLNCQAFRSELKASIPIKQK